MDVPVWIPKRPECINRAQIDLTLQIRKGFAHQEANYKQTINLNLHESMMSSIFCFCFDELEHC